MMMMRFVLILVLSLIVSRMFWRIVAAFRDGISGGQRSSPGPRRLPYPSSRVTTPPTYASTGESCPRRSERSTET